MLELSPFAENTAIFSINWPKLRKKLIRSEKYWWKLPIRSSRLSWLISRWYKNYMLKFFWNRLFPFYGSPKFKILSKVAKKKLTLIRPCKIYLRNSKIPEYPFVSPWNLPTRTDLAQSDLWIFQIWSIYLKFRHFSTQWNFPYISNDLHILW